VSDADAQSAIAAVSDDYPNAELQSRSEYIETQASQIDQLVARREQLLGPGDCGFLAARRDELEVAAWPGQSAVRIEVRHPRGETGEGGSVIVEKGQGVAAGERLAAVGSSGHSDGPHLHFEIWPDGWYASKQSKPIDLLPDLLAWAAG